MANRKEFVVGIAVTPVLSRNRKLGSAGKRVTRPRSGASTPRTHPPVDAPAPVACSFDDDLCSPSGLKIVFAYFSNTYGQGMTMRSKTTMLAKNLIDSIAVGFKRPADHNR